MEINIDEEKVEDDLPLLVTPALFENNKVVAYGTDIIEFLQNGTDKT